MKAFTQLAAIAAISITAPVAAIAQTPIEERSVTVKANDLDVSKQSDRQILKDRIRAAAAEVCRDPGGNGDLHEFQACKYAAKKKAMRPLREDRP